MLLVVLFFIGAFGGRTGRLIALTGLVVWFLWYIGLDWAGIPLPALRKFVGQAIVLAMVVTPDPTYVYVRWLGRTKRGVRHG